MLKFIAFPLYIFWVQINAIGKHAPATFLPPKVKQWVKAVYALPAIAAFKAKEAAA